MPKLYLIDGNAYIHRAYHALPPLTTSKGEMVNAVFGFLRMMLRIIREVRPDHIAVCFDFPAKNFRHAAYEQYKAHRKKIDDELKTQMPLAREAARILNLPVVEKEGFEADDVIATLTRQAERDGAEVVVVSSDKDTLQLVSDRVSVWNEARNVTYDREKVREKWGLYPEQLNDMFALMGDASDNVPGVPGVGEKTAVKLIQEYGSIENLLSNSGRLAGKLKDNVSAHAAEARLSKELVILHDRVPLDIGWRQCVPSPTDEKKVVEFLERMEFHSLLKEILPPAETPQPEPESRPPAVEVSFTTELVSSRDELNSLADAMRKSGKVSLDLETTGLDPYSCRIVGFSFAIEPSKAYYVPVGHTGLDAAKRQLGCAEVIERLKPLLEDPGIKKYGHNLKYDMLVLEQHGISLAGLYCDTMVASYCLNPSRTSHGLKTLAFDLLGHRMTEIEELIGKGAKQKTMDTVEIDRAANYAGDDAVAVLLLAERFEPELAKKGLNSLFHDVEMPLVAVLEKMEYAGIRVDVPYLQSLSKEFEGRIQGIKDDIMRLAGQEFNPNSPKQLSFILFEKLKLPVIRKTKTGFCTDEEVLRTLAPQHELPEKLIAFRELQKLKSTYIDALLQLNDPETHRIHTSFNQAVTATGRLSSSEPNLQNIPIRTEYGRMIRKAFIADRGHVLVSADYSQIDLRALAHVSKDPALVDAFRKGEDVHAATAHDIFNVPLSEVTPEQRRIAKTINFGIVYGMSAFSLSQQLGIAPGTAKDYIDSYFTKYAGVRKWMDAIVSEAGQRGYVTTLLGRIRYLPEINASNKQIRAFAERTAMNTPIQGTSADIIKVAMAHIDRYLAEQKAKTKMLVQVHDELLFEVPDDERATIVPSLRELMENAVRLDVPVIVDVKTGMNWSEMAKTGRAGA